MIIISRKSDIIYFLDKKGEYHRLNGPAVIRDDYQKWCLNDKLHRLDGPAFIDGDYQAWYLNDKLHREDGPAIIDGDYEEYWLEGVRYNEFDDLAKQEHDLEKLKDIR